MDQLEHKADFETWLRRTWSAVMRAAEAMERSPIEDVFDRLDRLEREMAALKNRKPLSQLPSRSRSQISNQSPLAIATKREFPKY
jgi:hypothetical protein